MANKRLLLFFALLLAVAAGLAPLTAWAQTTWSNPQVINDDTDFYVGDAQVAMDGLNVVAVWKQHYLRDHRIYSNYSSDGGATWHGAQLIGDNAYSHHPPIVVISGLNVVAVWHYFDDSSHRIYSNYSSDGGATWHSAQSIKDDDDFSVYAFRVAMDGLNVVAVWAQDNSTRSGYNSSIYNNYSSDGGATWHDAQLIEYNSEPYGCLPQVAIDGSNVVAVWSEQYYNVNNKSFHSLYSNYSSDGGATWHSAKMIEDNIWKICYDCVGPIIRVAIDNRNAVIVWTHEGAYEYNICCRYSRNGGSSWSKRKLLTTDYSRPG
jgi:Neuraminidase (sialidase)